MAAAEPTSPWQPTSAPEIEALVLMMPPMAAAVSRKSRMPLVGRADAVVAVVADHRRHDAGGAIGRRGDDLAAGGVLLVHRHRVDREPVVDGMRLGEVVAALGEQRLVDAPWRGGGP